MFYFRPHSRRINEEVVHPTDFLCAVRHGLASLDGRVRPDESGEEGEDNAVPQEEENSRHVSLSEGDSVTEVDFVEDNEDSSGAEQGKLRNLLDESLPAVTKNRRSANGNFRDDERFGFPGDPSSQQIHDTKMAISISSDENDALPLQNKKKLQKVSVHYSVNRQTSISSSTIFQVSTAILKHILLNRLFIF